jgi:hypothetical protein
MIEIQKQQKQQKNAITVIRPASSKELTEYEKEKLAGIDEQAQRNKIETIRVNGVRVPVDDETKTASIKVGDLAFKNVISDSDFDSNEYFFIKCELDDSAY